MKYATPPNMLDAKYTASPPTGLYRIEYRPLRIRAHRVHRAAAVGGDAMQCHPRLTHRHHAGCAGPNDATAHRARRQGLRLPVRAVVRDRGRVLAGDRRAATQCGDRAKRRRDAPTPHRLNLPKSSGRRFSRYCLSCSALSSSAVFAASKSWSSALLCFLALDGREQRLLREDRRGEPQRDRDAVGRPSVDLNEHVTAHDVQLGEVRALLHLRDLHPAELAARGRR